MSSTLRLSIIMVLLLATTALGLIAYSMNLPKAQVAAAPVPVAQVAEKAPEPVAARYFVAAHPLPRGTLVRDEDFTVRSVPASGGVPAGAILDTPDAKIGLRGSLVRTFLDTGSLITSENILRPRERGFLASVLAPDMRAISINVDAASGVSGLIWPGDYVDVVLTQEPTTSGTDKTAQQHGMLSETVAHNVRIVAIDQEIVQGGSANNATAGKVARTVSLQLAPEQVKKVTVAGQRGKLTLAVRSAVDRQDTGESDTTVVVYARDSGTKYSVKRDGAGNTRTVLGGDSREMSPSAPVASAVRQ
ncbi:MAG: Flp pilus assembly protein CpaB [Alphaproteobacteria bacterium]|nr:Flp pilus assembly protein CpaB [Alphaproteobacteria bacterium]